LVTINLLRTSEYSPELNLLTDEESNSMNDELELITENNQERIRSLNNYRNVQYYGNVHVGTPPQTFSVIFDTGSNLMWLPAENCDCRTTCKKYLFSKSTTFVNLNKTKNLRYSIGGVNGSVVSDTVAIAPSLTLNDFNFMMVNKEMNLEVMQADGVMGLGIDNEGNPKNSLIQQLYSQNHISAAKFTIYLSTEANGSRLILGDPADSPQLRTSVASMGSCPVASGDNYWACSMNSVTISNKGINLNAKVAFDSGSSFLIIPIADFKLLKPHLLDASKSTCGLTNLNQLVCKCTSPSVFPELNLVINGHSLNVPNSQMITYDRSAEYGCRFNLLVNLNQNEPWVLGDSVLRGVLVTYDVNGRTISYLKTSIPSELTIEEAKSSFWWWFFIILGIIVLAILAFVLYKYCFAGDSHEDKKETMLKNK